MQPSKPDAEADQPSTAHSDIRILLVDDDEKWVESTAKVLEHQRDLFTVTTATDIVTAEDVVADSEPDCLVCDYDLGPTTGLELLETLRPDDDRPFILITGQGDESLASDAIGQQVTDYIPKRSLSGRKDLLARRIEQAVESYRTERALARERRSKDAMLDILTATSSREGLVQEFCEHLHREHEYACVWIGTTRGSTGVTPRAVAGTESYPDAAIDPATTAENGTEPALRAVAADETYTVTGILPVADNDGGILAAADSDHAGDDGDGFDGRVDDWTAAAAEAGFESAAATPISHEGRQFGVLAVYGNTPSTGTEEVTLLEEYAETIGYALRSADWKESLLSATPVSIEFELAESSIPLVAVDRQLPADARIRVLTTALQADTLLYVLRVEGVPEAAFRERVAGLDATRELRVTDESDPIQCELVVPTPTPETVLADHGGQLRSATVADGTVSITAIHPDRTGVQSLREAMEAAYPGLTVRSVRATQPTEDSAADPLRSLTAKQRDALSVAYFCGYFERPRDNDTQAVAEKLDVSRQTFTQHLRTAERKVFEDLFDHTGGEQ